MKKAYHWVFIVAALFILGANQGCNFQKQPADLQKGTLQVLVVGLPQDDDLVIQIEGEGGFAEAVTQSEYEKEVPAGIYKIRANAITISNILYAPDSFEFLAKVEPGMTTKVVFSYADRGIYKATPASDTILLERGAVKSINSNAVVLRNDKVNAQSLSGGQILIYPGDLQFPEGFIRRILNVVTTNDGVIVETEQAALEDGYQELNIKLTKPLTEWEFASDMVHFVGGKADMDGLLALYDAKTLSKQSLVRLPIISPWREGDLGKLGEPWGISYKFDESIELNDGQLILEVAGEAGVSVDLDLQIVDHKLQSLNYSVEMSHTKRAELFLATAIEGWSGKKELPPISFGAWPIGVVVISPKVILGAQASIEPTGTSILTENLSLIKYQSTELMGGTLSYTRSEGTTLTTNSPSTTATVRVLANAEELSPTKSGVQITANIMPTAKLMLKFYEVIGPYFGIAVGPEGNIDLACANDPWWEVSLRGDALAGIQIGLGNFAVDVSSSGPIFDYPLARAEDLFSISRTNFALEAGDSAQFEVVSNSVFCAGDPLRLGLEGAPVGITINPSMLDRAGGDLALNTDPALGPGSFQPTLRISSESLIGLPTTREYPLNVEVSAPQKPHWSATPQQLSFSGVIGGSAPASKSFSLSNDGTASGSFALNTTATWLHASSPTQTLAPGEATSVAVSVDACTANDEGTTTAQISVEGGGSSVAVGVERVCTAAPTPKIRVSPTTLSFSNFGSMAQSFTVFNDGDADLAINGVFSEVSWAQVTGQPASSSISPGSSQTFEAKAVCTYLSASSTPYTGSLVINSNDPDSPATRVALELVCEPASYAIEAKDTDGSAPSGSYRAVAYWPNWDVAASTNSSSNILLFDVQLVGDEEYIFEIYHTPTTANVVPWVSPEEEFWGGFQRAVPTGMSTPPEIFTKSTAVFSGGASAPTTVSVGEVWKIEQAIVNNSAGYSLRMVLKVRYLDGSSYCQPCEVIGSASASNIVSASFQPEKPGAYEAVATLQANIAGEWRTVDQYSNTPVTFDARAPKIRVSPTQLSLGNLIVTNPTAPVVVYNDGQEDLFITNITDNRAWLSITNGSSQTIAPGSSYTYSVQGTCDHLSPGLYSGSLLIYNNDPENNPVTVGVTLDCLAGSIGINVMNVGGSVLDGEYRGVAFWGDYAQAAATTSSTNSLSFSDVLTGGYDYIFEIYHTPNAAYIPYWIIQWIDLIEEYWGNTQAFVRTNQSSQEQFTRSQPYMLGFVQTPPTSVSVGSTWTLQLNTAANTVGGTVRLHVYFRNRDGISSCNPSNCEAAGSSTVAGGVVQATFVPSSPGTYDAFAVLETLIGGKWVPVDQWGSAQVVSFTAQ